jgi:hypothetical protein
MFTVALPTHQSSRIADTRRVRDLIMYTWTNNVVYQRRLSSEGEVRWVLVRERKRTSTRVEMRQETDKKKGRVCSAIPF